MVRSVRGEGPRPLPRRFYKQVSVSATLGILLDGKTVKTPLKAELALPTPALAAAVAAEWAAQAEVINPHAMPLTKLANTAIDRTAGNGEAITRDILAYAGNDLVCYRADYPQDLAARQAREWDPVLAWVKDRTGRAFRPTQGVGHVPQEPEALAALRPLLPDDPFLLVGYHALTTLSGSALLAMMTAERALPPPQAWEAATLDEQWQAEQWGWDSEAAAAHEARWIEFRAAAEFVYLAKGFAAEAGPLP